MLLNFTDDYINTIFNARLLIGEINFVLSSKEPYMGESKFLDKLYAQSITMAGIIDYLENDDNSDPRVNEGFLMCLRELLSKNISGIRRNSTANKSSVNYSDWRRNRNRWDYFYNRS
jgi:hypothetical protein